MKVIDLLNKIANNEEVPKEIKYYGVLCSFDNEDKDYYCEEYGNLVWYLVDTSSNMNEVLETDLEIIEEKPKKIEELKIKNIYKCDDYQQIYINFKETWNKINEIIDYLLEKESDK